MKSSKQFCLAASLPAWRHLAELPAAADVSHRVDPALLQPQQQLGIESRHQRDAETAVRGQQRRRGPVTRRARCGDNAERDTGTVLRRRELAGHLVPGQVDGGGRPQCGWPGRFAVRCHPPGRRLGEGLPRPGDPVLPQDREPGGVRRHRAHRRDRHRGKWPALAVEGPHLLRPAAGVHDPDGVASYREVFDDRATRRDDLVGAGDRDATGQRQAEHLAVRGVPEGKQVQGVRAEHGLHALVRNACHLPPRAAGILATEEDLPLAAIPFLHPVHDPAAVRSGGQVVLRDPLVGEGASEVSAVRRATQLAEPHLLPEPGGISAAGVPEPRAVVTPGHRSAHQIHMRDRLVGDLPAPHVVDVQRPVLGAMLRQRDRDPPAVRGRNEEVDGGLARRVEGIRIHHDTLGGRVVQVGQGHQERPLPWRLHLQCEEGGPAGQEPLVHRLVGLQQLLDPGAQRVPPADPAEVGTAAVLLGLRPGDGLC